MNRTLPIHYDDTPSGHSFAAGWTVLWVFGLAGVFLYGLAFEAALHHFFGV